MKYLIPAAVGALIGYITNWLAIKMLFRPHNEVRVFGVRLPFTPGLIPKEKERIAQSVGSAVGTHLLSPEIVVDSLCGEKINKEISRYIEEKVIKLKESPKTVGDILRQYMHNLKNIKEDIKNMTSEYIYNLLRQDNIKEAVVSFAEKYTSKGFEYFLKGKPKITFMHVLENRVLDAVNSDEFKQGCRHKILDKINALKDNNKTFLEIVPPSIINGIKIYIYSNGDKEAKLLSDVIKNDSVRFEIKKIISQIIEQNLGKLVTMFVNPGFVSEKILSSMEKYLENPINNEKISSVFANIADSLLQSSISDIMSSIPESSRDLIADGIIDIPVNFIQNEQNRRRIIHALEKWIKENENSIQKNIINYIKHTINKISHSPETKKNIENIIEKILAAIVNLPLSSVLQRVNKNNISSFILFVHETFGDFIKSKASYIVELMNIPSMVEERINSFDAAFAEKVIIEVASKELKAITWLGALLGGIMGLLTPIMEMLYR